MIHAVPFFVHLISSSLRTMQSYSLSIQPPFLHEPCGPNLYPCNFLFFKKTRSSSLSVQFSLPPLTILDPSKLLLPAKPSIHLKGPIAIVFSSVNLRYILVYPTASSSIMQSIVCLSSVHLLHHVTLCLSVQRPLLQSTRGWGGGGGGGGEGGGVRWGWGVGAHFHIKLNL